MLRVGVLIDRLNVGGVEKIAIEEVIALRKIKVDASLLILRRKGIDNSAFRDIRKNLPVIFLDDRVPSFLKFSFNFPVFHFFSLFHLTYPLFIPFIVRDQEFDYIFSHGTYTSLTALMIKKIKRIEYAIFIWDPISYIIKRVYSTKLGVFTDFFLYIATVFDKILVSNAHKVLVGGKAHNKFLKELGIKAVVIPPSVHPRKQISKNKNKKILLVTAWKEGKNPEFLFRILSINKKIKFQIAGKWLKNEYKREFTNQANRLGYKNNINIIGEVSEKRLSTLYSQALAVLQVNDDRGFGMPALEAAGNGTAFIIPEKQGVCDFFKNGIDGYFVKEKDASKITGIIEDFLSNPRKAHKMGKHGWDTVIQNYSWEKHAMKMAAMLVEKRK